MTKKNDDFLKKLKWQSKIHRRCFFKTYKLNERAKYIADAIHTLIQIECMLKPEYRVSIEKMTNGISFEVYPRDCVNTLYHKYIITRKRTRLNICKQIDAIKKELWQRDFIAEEDLRPLHWIWN